MVEGCGFFCFEAEELDQVDMEFEGFIHGRNDVGGTLRGKSVDSG